MPERLDFVERLQAISIKVKVRIVQYVFNLFGVTGALRFVMALERLGLKKLLGEPNRKLPPTEAYSVAFANVFLCLLLKLFYLFPCLFRCIEPLLIATNVRLRQVCGQ